MRRMILFAVLLIMAATLGCKDPTKKTAEKEKDAPSKTGIFGKKGGISEFDPSDGNRVSDGKAKSANPLNPLAPLRAYGPAMEKISKMGVQRAVNLFHAEKGRYPRDFPEFMDRIIRANGIELPKLPGDLEYQYDVENHELVIVEIKPAEEK